MSEETADGRVDGDSGTACLAAGRVATAAGGAGCHGRGAGIFGLDSSALERAAGSSAYALAKASRLASAAKQRLDRQARRSSLKPPFRE
jgi:hypothetical protein